MESGSSMRCLSPVLARKSLEERGTWMEENELVSRSIEGWKDSFVVFKYTALVTVNELVERCIGREQFNEKKSPTLSCELAIEVFCVLYSWRFVSFCRRCFGHHPSCCFAIQPSPLSRTLLVARPV